MIALICQEWPSAFATHEQASGLCFGQAADGEIMVASESVALEGTARRRRDLAPGEALFISTVHMV